MNFDSAFGQLMLHEGGYSNDAHDNGGATRYGITEGVAREVGYRGDMRELPLDLAKRIYRDRYWDAMCCDDLPASIRHAVFDAAVNSGVAQSARWLQRAVGVEADGVIGPKTLAAVKDTPPDALRCHILSNRLRMMTGLPSWEFFGRGWAKRVCDLLDA